MLEKKQLIFITIAAVIAVSSVVMYFVRERTPNAVEQTNEQPAKHTNLSGKKIMWVNSYHKGYAWSDYEFLATQKELDETGIVLEQFYMDTKLHDSEEFGKKSALKAKLKIEEFKPDLIIAADDAAQKYLIVPYFKNTKLPVVFCGVNWDASEYGYPAKNITGVLEVDLMEKLLGYLREHAKGKKVAFVAGNDLTERRLYSVYNRKFFSGELLYFLTKENNFEQFIAAFMKAQEKADLIILSGNGSIGDWDEEKARKFFIENTTKPTGTVNEWMIKYSLVAYNRLPEEQGQLAAQMATRILSGESPADIPITQNVMGQLLINLDIAESMNVVFSPALLKNAKIYQGKDSDE